MKRVILALVLVAATAVAQEQPAHSPEAAGTPAGQSQAGQHGDAQVPHGGEEAVSPGGPNESGTHAEGVAKHGEAHEQATMPHEIWWKWANFAILAGLLGWLIAKNAGPFFQSRSEGIQRGIQEAAKVREEAEARAAEIERRVANLSGEVAQLRQQSHEEIAREGERVRTETEAQIRKVQAQAESEIASAAKHASQDLKAYSAQLALELAERQIRDRMTPQVQEQLTDAFVDEVTRKADGASKAVVN